MRLNAHHTRLSALIGVLIVLASYAVTRWNNIHGGGGESAGAVFSSAPCPPAEPPEPQHRQPQGAAAPPRRHRAGHIVQHAASPLRTGPGRFKRRLVRCRTERLHRSFAGPAGLRRLRDALVDAGWKNNVVVDGFIFPSAKVAHTYFEQAAADDCRRDSSTRGAPFPDDARNLQLGEPGRLRAAGPLRAQGPARLWRGGGQSRSR